VLDPGSGRTVLDVPWTSSGGGGLYADGESLIGYGIDLQNRVIVARWSLLTGEEEWFVTGDEARAVPTLHAAEERIVLAGSRTVAIDLRTGAVVPDAPRPVVVLGPIGLPDGGTAVAEQQSDGTQELVVRDASGAVRFRRAGSLVLPTVEDPGARAVLLVSVNGGLVAVDPGTGRDLWSTPTATAGSAPSDGWGGYSYPLADLAGLVLVGGSGEPVALDLRTGERRWAASVQGAGGPAPCDGYRVGVLDVGVEKSFLVVLDLHDGSEVRRQELPFAEPSQLIALPDGLLAQVTGTDVAVLGPERPER
jgi:outer membrane protein assembly factor BamB